MRLRHSRPHVRAVFEIVALGLLIVWLVGLSWEMLGREERARREAARARGDLAALEERGATLKNDLDVLSSPRGEDAAIRESFGVAREGEEVIIVLPPPAATTSPPELSLWSRFWAWLNW